MGWHDFYAEHLGYVYKVRSDIPVDSLQYAASNLMAECTDIFTGERLSLRVLGLNPLNAMEVLAWAKLKGDVDRRPGTEPQPSRIRSRPLDLGGKSET